MSVFLFLVIFARVSTGYKPEEGSDHAEVQLSAKLLSSGLQQLQLIWTVRKHEPDDTISLVGENNTNLYTVLSLEPYGAIDTGVPYNSSRTYTALYRRDNETYIVNNTMRNYVDWMWMMRKDIGPMAIEDIFLPGTHNSAAYKKPIAKRTNPFAMFEKYIYTQDEDIEAQFKRGARFFDIRVGYYGNSGSEDSQVFWLNHDFVKLSPLQNLLDQIKKCLNTTREIVVLDFHHFPVGFTDDSAHNRLASYITKEMGEYLFLGGTMGSPWSTDVDALWAQRRQLIVAYNKPGIWKKFRFFSPVRQIWANAQSVSNVYEYVDSQVYRYWNCLDNRYTATMLEMTPTTKGVMTDSHGGLRNMAHQINPDLSIRLLRFPCWADKFQAIAVDFLSSTSVVHAAIVANMRRARDYKIVQGCPGCNVDLKNIYDIDRKVPLEIYF